MQKGFSRSFFYVNALLRGMVYDDKAQAHTHKHAHPDTHTHTQAQAQSQAHNMCGVK